ncbi:stage V sporulation protein AE [Heliophilum fasciatum]|uniref:Stage V sporulation protein AE n=1 Tax=Heliophilum fasciatum TaxID=35700 RepID=A0A4V2SXS0_9FIRM|nr:stage V sporulation protein AE [Heliophilum fasciatum]MCW2277370.1 stage V sporulation protein AE [Heliophilum fasciatum]TCP67206.1 stage V sporulation protein AE [Heliophilum fasciatum]
MNRRQVIVVTDGDDEAQQAVQLAAAQVGARCLLASAGNPTPLSGETLIALIMEEPGEPVVVMVDDRGQQGRGAGEAVLAVLAQDERIELLGVIAVAASRSGGGESAHVDGSIDRTGRWTEGAVDKFGYRTEGRLIGDTISVLEELPVPLVVGMGDPGKMNGADRVEAGAAVTTAALQVILQAAEQRNGGGEQHAGTRAANSGTQAKRQS